MLDNKQVIEELVEVVLAAVSDHVSGNTIMLTPAINILKLKLRSLTHEDAEALVDTIHKISHMIESKTGTLSPYHGIDVVPVNSLMTHSE